MFDNILNWKLLEGSHAFPGEDGGTCINEAAIVAAGFKYRRITMAQDCPRCFSRPISEFALGLNDEMSDDLRQELLMPFVTRLAGTRDKPVVELERAKLIVYRTVRDVLPLALVVAGFTDYAKRCERSNNFNSAAQAILDGRYAIEAVNHPLCEVVMRLAIESVVDLIDLKRPVSPAEHASHIIGEVASTMEDYCEKTARNVFRVSVSILDEAIKLGKQAPAIDTALIVERMEAAKCKEMAPC